MNIEIQKVTPYQCAYTLTRADKSVERITLETKTYLLHDICHYAVERHLHYTNGFWGMLARGHSFTELFGKDNPQTAALRFIEKIVGPVQSVYLGYIPEPDFEAFISHLHFPMPEGVLSACLAQIGCILTEWEQLSPGQYLTLEWKS